MSSMSITTGARSWTRSSGSRPLVATRRRVSTATAGPGSASRSSWPANLSRFRSGSPTEARLMRTLGVIPARGGSKGVPRKNVRLVAGEPLLAYSIVAARESTLLTSFLTTTDDDEIMDVARSLGSPVLRRPADLARDETPMVPVLLHALEHAEREE